MRTTFLAFAALALAAHLGFAADPDSATCELHSQKMSRKKVPIHYGLPLFSKYDEKMLKAEQKSFPHAPDYVLGGCVVEKEKEKTVFECTVCRANKDEWLAKNPRPKP